MGRWGDGIYESDSSLDYLAVTVSHTLERELTHLIFPKQIKQSANWLFEVLTIIEIMLLFDRRKLDYNVLLHIDFKPEIVAHSKHVVLNIWDQQWDTQEKSFHYSQSKYRSENRHTLQSWFERLEVICEYYYGDDNIDENGYILDLETFNSTVELPYFSSVSPVGLHQPMSGVAKRLCSLLRQTIMYTVASENRAYLLDMFSRIEHVYMCIDVLGFLCESYDWSPEITVKMLVYWEQQMIDAWKQRLPSFVFIESEGYKDVKIAIERLKKIVEKHLNNPRY